MLEKVCFGQKQSQLSISGLLKNAANFLKKIKNNYQTGCVTCITLTLFLYKKNAFSVIQITLLF